MSDNVVLEKSMAFAIRIVRLSQYLQNEKHDYVLSKQIVRSGTAIGSNATEAVDGISRRDFLNKMYIALKECSETRYWIELLYRTDYITKQEYASIMSDCKELRRILSSITKSTKESPYTDRLHKL